MRVLLLHLDPARGGALAESLREDGHIVTAISVAPAERIDFDVLVVCLDASPQRALDLAGTTGVVCDVPAAQVLFVGGPPAALGEAQRRFPKASFARMDTLSTALASMEA